MSWWFAPVALLALQLTVPSAYAADPPPRKDLSGDPLPPHALVRMGTTRFRQGASSIVEVRFSADGRGILTIGDNHTARVWEAATGKERFHVNAIAAEYFDLAPDFQTVLTRKDYPALQVWEPLTGKHRLELNGREPQLGHACFTPDGKQVAVVIGRSDGTAAIQVYEVATARLLRQLEFEPPVKGEEPFIPRRLKFAAGGRILVASQHVGADESSVRLLDFLTGKQRPIPKEDLREKWFPTVSPDGRIVAVVAARKDNTRWLRLLDVATGAIVRDLEALPEGEPLGMRIAPTGRTIAVVMEQENNDGILLWQVADGKPLGTLRVEKWVVIGMGFAPDGRSLVVETSTDIRLYDASTHELLRKWDTSSPTYYLPRQSGIMDRVLRPTARFAFSPDGQWLAAESNGDRLRLWNVTTGKEMQPGSPGHAEAVEAIAVSPDGKTLASVSDDGTCRLWETATGRQVRVLPVADRNDIGFQELGWPGGCCVAFSPDGRTVAACSRFNVVRLWDVGTGEQRHQIVVPCGGERWMGGIDSLAFSHDGKQLVTGGRGTILAWDTSTGKQLHRYAWPDADAPDRHDGDMGWQPSLHIAVSPDGRVLAATDMREEFGFEVRFWELATGTPRRQWPKEPPELLRNRQVPWHYHHSYPMIVFAQDNRTIAWQTGDGLEVWDLAGGSSRCRVGTISQQLTAAAFSPSGKVLATVGWGGRVRLYDATSGQLLGETSATQGQLNCLAFSPDGHTLFTGGADSTILAWDAAALGKASPHSTRRLTESELDTLWKQLASLQGSEAADAIARLEAAPQQATAMLRERLHLVAVPDGRRLARLVAGLGADDFEIRQRATTELEKLAELAAPALRKRLAESPPAEERKRLEQLLERLEGFVRQPEQVQALRAVEVLEVIGSDEARAILRSLADGAPDALLTREVKASLKRLAARP